MNSFTYPIKLSRKGVVVVAGNLIRAGCKYYKQLRPFEKERMIYVIKVLYGIFRKENMYEHDEIIERYQRIKKMCCATGVEDTIDCYSILSESNQILLSGIDIKPLNHILSTLVYTIFAFERHHSLEKRVKYAWVATVGALTSIYKALTK
jgi:hypothetical protein